MRRLACVSGWLIDAYLGLQLQRAANRLLSDRSLTAQIAKSEERLRALRTGPRGVEVLGSWPWATNGSAEILIEDEVGDLARLKALTEPSQ